MQDLVDLPLAAEVEPVADDVARGCGDRGGAVERGEVPGGGVAPDVADDGDDGGGCDPTDAVEELMTRSAKRENWLPDALQDELQ